MHTPDSSRYWVAATYEERLAAGEEPESLDKEVVRRALADAGYSGDGDAARAARDVWAATSARYIDAYERLTGLPFEPGAYPVDDRIAMRRDAHESRTPCDHDPRRPSTSTTTPREECGVLGISTPHGEGVAQLVVLRAVRAAAPRPGGRRHRRQRRPAGRGCTRTPGSVANVFTPDDAGAAHRLPRHRPHPLLDDRASNAQRNIQPFLVETMHGPLALAHNGNIVNAPALRDELLTRGFGLTATSDTEVMTLMLAAAGGRRGRSASSARCRRGRAPSRSCCWPPTG